MVEQNCGDAGGKDEPEAEKPAQAEEGRGRKSRRALPEAVTRSEHE